jgi:hypothetical protein
MKLSAFARFLALMAAPLLAQTPSVEVHTSSLGFSYSLPSDWETVDPQAQLPAAKQQGAQNATSDAEKKGIACVQVAFSARHGVSAIVVVALPFDCYGQTMTADRLPGFGKGAAEGLEQTFDVTHPVLGTYMLGDHPMWIERASGTPKGRTQPVYTVEIACTLLTKAAVCWMTIAADADDLHVFERGIVTLDRPPNDYTAFPLVPSNAFDKQPQP